MKGLKMEHTKKQAIIEAMLFANGKEVSSKNLMSALEINAEELEKIIGLLKQKYESENSGIELIKNMRKWSKYHLYAY